MSQCAECLGIGSVRPEGEPVHSHAAVECEACEGTGRVCADCGEPIPVCFPRGQTTCRECNTPEDNLPKLRALIAEARSR